MIQDYNYFDPLKKLITYYHLTPYFNNINYCGRLKILNITTALKMHISKLLLNIRL